MKKFCLAICISIQVFSFGQIQFDSCFVYKNFENSDLKENGLLFEIWQLSGSSVKCEKLSTTDAQTLTQAVNRATNMNFSIPKIGANVVFVKCYSKAVLYGFVLQASKHLMIDVVRNVKLVFENKEDIEFLNRLESQYIFKK